MSPSRPIPNSLEALLRDQALAYPETSEEFPWGERVAKVRGKIFIFMRATGTELSFSVKIPRSGAEALELGYVEPSGYGLGKHGWVTVRVDLTREAPVDSFRAWLDESYRTVAPKALVARLDAPGGASPPAAEPVATTAASAASAKAKKRPAAKKRASTTSRARSRAKKKATTSRAKAKKRR
jgi:predicted DNA-binding protein (MmcQ/YjbR family)